MNKIIFGTKFFKKKQKNSEVEVTNTGSVKKTKKIAENQLLNIREMWEKQSFCSLEKHFKYEFIADSVLLNDLTLKDFQIIREIASGNSSSVYLTHYAGTNCLFACKITRDDFIEKCKLSQLALEREFHIGKTLNHHHIIKMHRLIHRLTPKGSTQLNFIMEYVRGIELWEIMNNLQNQTNHKVMRLIPFAKTKHYFGQILSALLYMHNPSLHQNNKVVYRDLKPENIIIDTEDNVKIVDLGFVKEISVEDMTNTSCGTPGYAAPELICGKPYNESVDWWSAGILLYEMLFGFTHFCNFIDVVREELKKPKKMTEEELIAWDFIKGLVIKEADVRMKFVEDNIVKDGFMHFTHPFFETVEMAQYLSTDQIVHSIYSDQN